ncbi:MAG: glutaminyl-peptide cyclotransferase [Candidatus Krumholzibacteriaceae bacterium]|jgi:glutamine cyclotransferase
MYALHRRESSIRTAAAPVCGYRIIHAYPHDPGAFTQGLIYRDGFLFESTGLNGRSTLRKVRLETGEVIRERALEPQYFGEGLTDWGDTLIQLTWKSNVAFLYDEDTFAARGTFGYDGEGWGLTHDARRLIMSDGSASLRFLDPATFRETGRLLVTDRGFPVGDLNELELVKGEIYANVWETDRIAMISPTSGLVTGWIDLGGLAPSTVDTGAGDAVLNGIAYDARGDRLFVTGKLWPTLFEIRLVRRH